MTPKKFEVKTFEAGSLMQILFSTFKSGLLSTSRFLTPLTFDANIFDNSGPFDDKNFEAHEEFQIFDAKIIFHTFDDEKFDNKKLDAKMDFQTIHVKELPSFPRYYIF